MKYIGVRTSKVHPTEDVLYWGSSKHLPKDVKVTHKKRILRIFDSRESAVQHEIYLHNKYNVAQNSEFYNRSKQTSTKFDTTGISTPCPDHVKELLRKQRTGKKRPKEVVEAMRQRMLGTTQSKETVDKRKASWETTTKNKGINAFNFRPWYISTAMVTYLFFDVTKNEQSVIDGHYKKYYADIIKRQNATGKIVNTKKYGPAFIGDIPNLKI